MIACFSLARGFRRMLLLWILAGVSPGEAQATPREAMIDAMVKMMDAMGVFEPSNLPPPVPPLLNPPSWNPNAVLADPARAAAQGGALVGSVASGLAQPGQANGSRLEGIWEGRDGELLIIQGNRFRIYPGSAGYIDGYLQFRGERLAMYNPEEANIRPFDYAEFEGRLVLRDPAGTLYLYRRLWFENPPGTAAPPAHAPR